MGSPTYREKKGRKDWDNVPKHGRNGKRIISIKSKQARYLKNTIKNEGMSIIGITEVISNWIKIPIRENIYNRTEG